LRRAVSPFRAPTWDSRATAVVPPSSLLQPPRLPRHTTGGSSFKDRGASPLHPPTPSPPVSGLDGGSAPPFPRPAKARNALSSFVDLSSPTESLAPMARSQAPRSPAEYPPFLSSWYVAAVGLNSSFACPQNDSDLVWASRGGLSHPATVTQSQQSESLAACWIVSQ